MNSSGSMPFSFGPPISPVSANNTQPIQNAFGAQPADTQHSNLIFSNIGPTATITPSTSFFGAPNLSTNTFGGFGTEKSISTQQKQQSFLFNKSNATDSTTNIFNAQRTTQQLSANKQFGSTGFGNVGSSIFGSSLATNQFNTTGSTGFGGFGFGSTCTTATPCFGAFRNQNNSVFTPTTKNQTNFEPLTGTDVVIKNGLQNIIPVRYQSVAFLKENDTKSFEELRYEEEKQKKTKFDESSPIAKSLSDSILKFKYEYDFKINKIEQLRDEIEKKSNNLIDQVLEAKKKLLKETDSIEDRLKKFKANEKTINNVLDIISTNKVDVTNENMFTEMKSCYSNYLSTLDSFKDLNFDYELVENLDLDASNIGVIKNLAEKSDTEMELYLAELESSLFKFNKSYADLLLANSEARLNEIKKVKNPNSFSIKPFEKEEHSASQNQTPSLFGNIQATAFSVSNQPDKSIFSNLNQTNSFILQEQSSTGLFGDLKPLKPFDQIMDKTIVENNTKPFGFFDLKTPIDNPVENETRNEKGEKKENSFTSINESNETENKPIVDTEEIGIKNDKEEKCEYSSIPESSESEYDDDELDDSLPNK